METHSLVRFPINQNGISGITWYSTPRFIAAFYFLAYRVSEQEISDDKSYFK